MNTRINWSEYTTAVDVIDNTRRNTFIEICADERLAASLFSDLAEVDNYEHWIFADVGARIRFRQVGIPKVGALTMEARDNAEVLNALERAYRERVRRVVIVLNNALETTRHTLMFEISKSIRLHPDTQVIVVNDAMESVCASYAPCRFSLGFEKGVFCDIAVDRLIKIDRVPVYKRFERKHWHLGLWTQCPKLQEQQIPYEDSRSVTAVFGY